MARYILTNHDIALSILFEPFPRQSSHLDTVSKEQAHYPPNTKSQVSFLMHNHVTRQMNKDFQTKQEQNTDGDACNHFSLDLTGD